jgi:hypothetical protein
MNDPITFWNKVLLDCNARDHTAATGTGDQRGPTKTSRAFAMAQLAMHDAWFGITGVHPTFLHGLPAAGGGANPAAAVKTAGQEILMHLYPQQRNFILDEARKDMVSGSGTAAGHAYGEHVARAMIAHRDKDGSEVDPPHTHADYRGAHRPDPDGPPTMPSLGASWGKVKAFVTPLQPLAPNPAPSSPEYNLSLEEVRKKGATPDYLELIRTPDETTQGIFWGYDGASGLGTPPRLYFQIVRELSDLHTLTTDQRARLFGLVAAALGDAGIQAWHWKYVYDLWRPVVGIREHDASFGPQAQAGKPTVGDPFWLPLGAPKSNEAGAKNSTPNFPAYPSGHATFGGAVFQVVRLYLQSQGLALLTDDGQPVQNDNVSFSFVSDEMNGITTDNRGTVRPRHLRHFASLREAMMENGFSRVALGVHWKFDAFSDDPNVGGLPLGIAIANQVCQVFGGIAAANPTQAVKAAKKARRRA